MSSTLIARLPAPCGSLVVHEDRLYMSGHTDIRPLLKTLPPGEPIPDDGKGGIWTVPVSARTEERPVQVVSTFQPYVLAIDDEHVWFESFGGIRRAPRNGGGRPVERVAYFNAFWVSIDGEHAYILVPHSCFRIPQYRLLRGDEEDVSLTVHGNFSRVVAPPDLDWFFTLDVAKNGKSTNLLVHDKHQSTSKPTRLATIKGAGRQLAIVGGRHAVVLACSDEPIRIVSLMSRDGPCRVIAESEGAAGFTIANDGRIYFFDAKLSRLLRTHVDGCSVERATADQVPKLAKTDPFLVHGRTLFYGLAHPDEGHSVWRHDLI